MNIGDLIFAPIHRSKPYDLYLARVTGFQQQQQQQSGISDDIRLGTVSFEFLRESFGESSDIADHLYKPEEYSWRYCYETKNNDDDDDENTTCHHRIMMPNDKTFTELEKVRKRLRSEYFLKNQLAGSSFAIHQTKMDSDDAAGSFCSFPTTTGLLSTSSPRVAAGGTSNNEDDMSISAESLKQLHTLFPLAILLELFFVVCFDDDKNDNDDNDKNEDDDEVQISDERIKSSNSSGRNSIQSSSIHVRIVDLWLSSFVMNFPNFLLLKSEFDVQLMMSNENLDHHNVDDIKSTSKSTSSRVPEDQMLNHLQQLSPFHQALLSTSANREKMEAEIDKKKLLSSSSSSSLSDYALVYSTSQAADLWFEYYYRVFVLSSSSSSSTPNKVKIDIISLKKLFETGGESFSDDDDHDDEEENCVYYRLFIGTVDEIALLLEKQRGISTTKNSSSPTSLSFPRRHRHDQNLIRNLTIVPGDDSIEVVAGLAELEVDILEDEMKLEEEEENKTNPNNNEKMNFCDAALPTTTYNTHQPRKVNFTHVDSQQIFTTSKIGNLLLAKNKKKSSVATASRTRSSHQYNNSKKTLTVLEDQTVKNTNEEKNKSYSCNPFLFPEGALLGWMMNATASLNKFRQQTLSNFYLGSRKLCRWGCCCSCVAAPSSSSSSKSNKNNDTTTFASPRLAPCCSLIPCFPISLFDTSASTTARSSSSSRQQRQPPPLFDVNDDFKLLKTFFKLNSKDNKMNSSSTKNNRILLVLQVDIDGSEDDDDEPATSTTKMRQMIQDYFKAKVDELVLRNKEESSSTMINLDIIPLVVFSHEVESFVSFSSSFSPGLCHTLFHDILCVWLSSSSSGATTTFDGIILNTTFYRVRVRSHDIDDMIVTPLQQKQQHDDKVALFASSQRQLALFIHSTLLSLNATTVCASGVVVTSSKMNNVFRSSCVTRRKYHTLFEDSSPSPSIARKRQQHRYVTEMMLLHDHHQNQQSSNDDEMKLFRPLPELRKLQPVVFVRSFDFMDQGGEEEEQQQDLFCPYLPPSAITAVERLLFCPVVSNNNNNNNIEEINVINRKQQEEENLSNIPFVSHLANLSKKVVPEPFYQVMKHNNQEDSSNNNINQKKKKNDTSNSSTSGLRWVSSLWL